MAESGKIEAEMDEAIKKVSEELNNGTPEKTVEESPAKTGEEEPTPNPEEAPKPFVADDALTERAIRAGLSLKDVKAFASAEFAESILSRLEAKSKSEEAKVEEPEGDDSPTKAFDDMLAKMKEDGEYNEDFIKMFEGMSNLLKAQAKELASLRSDGKSAAAKSFFDTQVSSLGEGVAKHLDAASKSKLEAKFKVLKSAYESAKVKMTDEEVFKEAAKLAIGDILEKAAAEGKTAKVQERRNLTIARPGGEQGHNGKTAAQSLDDIVAAVAKELE